MQRTGVVACFFQPGHLDDDCLVLVEEGMQKKTGNRRKLEIVTNQSVH